MDDLRYRTMLTEIAREMTERELESMKYMCSSQIPKGVLEEIDTPLKLWTALEERTKMSSNDTSFLRYLLENCIDKRTDLINILDRHTRPGGPFIPGPQHHGGTVPIPEDVEDAIDVIVSDIGKNWRALARKLGLSEADIDSCVEKHPRELREQTREALNMWTRNPESDVTRETLCTALKKCQLKFLADTIERGHSQLN